MIIKRRPKKKELWVERPDGQKIKISSLDDPKRLDKIKEKFERNLIKSGSKYSIDQFRFYFE